MNDVEAVASGLSFDDLLQAVNESSRGRWFLEEYQKRVRKTETGEILSAINRIEARLGNVPAAGVATGEFEKAKAALNAARADIAKLAPASGMTEEGRLFASLAELARKALPAEKTTAELAPGIVKALQLVDELDSTLNGSIKSDRFFKQDQAIFEPAAAQPKPVLVSVKPEAEKPQEPTQAAVAPGVSDLPTNKIATKVDAEAPTQGAKLVIMKTGTAAASGEAPAKPEVLEPENKTPDAPPPSLEVGKPQPVALEKIDSPRIVIIRRKPEEMTEVPLADVTKTETAA